MSVSILCFFEGWCRSNLSAFFIVPGHSLFRCKGSNWADFPVFRKCPVVRRLERAIVTNIWSQASIFVLMVDCLLAVLEHPPTELARVGALFPMDVLLVLVQHNIGDESFAALVTCFPYAHVYGL